MGVPQDLNSHPNIKYVELDIKVSLNTTTNRHLNHNLNVSNVLAITDQILTKL